MRKNEIKRTIEEVVRVEYIAADETIFYDEEECKKYEESALFTVSSKLKRLSTDCTSIYDLNEDGSDECSLEIFDIQTENDLDNLKKYLYLKMTKNGASEHSIKSCFSSEDRKGYTFEGITKGHEVMIFWSYDQDWFWTYKDGSLDGYLSWIKDKYTKIVAATEKKKEE